ncbi:L-lysine 6-transaminase [Nocardia cyriacigeorgica]|uniref:L-lysine-epsilon aminotransferase n=2 Tax=Nocardia cyriacigeorgica TaxID=135487 RepID=H6R2K6_NOCCG|nr:L-lysine 6-transaminase [Nocardia cyriacigeorgica]MBF6425518.1 L-lysine 6-transaminase [Nocardia cyriacigeorgica]NEW31844.1 L-lysine 6-transaminase [Nocardia cyriacigeorgica]BDT85275.1 putative aminotransferase class-III [Nocardia cyriacigeorgica]CCF61856.1 L-lysine aminotransferase [Nocardia cyriacigeorgica GUH-2]
MTIELERTRSDGDEESVTTASRVHEILSASILADGFELVLDLRRSQGRHLVDERDGTVYLDMFGFFASNALGMNHPALAGDEAFVAELATAALNKPSNSDIYTVAMARFVQTFVRVLGDPRLPHLFFIDGGGLAVENALKVAFDWKSRHNESHGRSPRLGTQVMHLTGAFHGRTGYTLSLTNTDPVKTARFPVFEWPRIDAPYLGEGRDIAAAEQLALDQAARAFAENPHDIACFIAEPIQGEGGDRHLRPEFLAAMQQLCHDNDALFVLDEVQTGVGMTGTTWAYQQLGLTPDVVAFGKKTQVCGVMAGGRVDEVSDNVFAVSSRLNSTWGGNLTDMVRTRRILEVIERDGLVDRARLLGVHLLDGLTELAQRHPTVTEPRGRGLMCAITLPDTRFRDDVLTQLREREHVLLLGTGERGIRFRPPLTVTTEELDAAVTALDRVLTDLP